MGLSSFADIVVTDCYPVLRLRIAGENILRDERAREILLGLEGSTSDSEGLPEDPVPASMKGRVDDFTVVVDLANELPG